MSDVQIQQVLAEMRALAARARGNEAPAAESARFAELLEQSVAQVNAAQQEAGQLTTRFAQGAEDVGLAEVMISMQKASLQFEAVTQVRNRLIAAYQEIMSMQV